MGSLVSGSRLRGEFEEKMEKMIAELKSDDKSILFFDEIHLAIGAGRAEGGMMDVANLLKPSLARGEIRCIGATTYTEYKQNMKSDGAFARRFILVDVPEPEPTQAIEMLKGVRKAYELHHSVAIQDEAILVAVEKATEISERHLPDSAIDLLDEGCVRCLSEGRQTVTANDIQLQKNNPVLSKL